VGTLTWACAEIRLLRPYRHAAMRAHAEVTAGRRLPSGRLDAVVVQRAGWPEASVDEVARVVREVRRRGAKLICDLDDDLLAEHPSGVTEAQLARLRPRVRLLLREADLVIVSTAPLAERVRRLNPNVALWRNAIDEALARPPRPASAMEGADIGYFGTLSHLHDLLAVIGSLEAGLDGLARRPQVELCGIADDPRLVQLLARHGTVRTLPVDGDYAAFIDGLQSRPAWKVGLAPVAGGPFNASKSDIKFLDYALAGIPGVYADCDAYADVEHGRTGLKAPLGDFGAAARRLLDEPELRRAIRATAREHVLQERSLARRVPELWDIVQRAL
jgi:glycosyltransferase involved in cell wall biosynthesis